MSRISAASSLLIGSLAATMLAAKPADDPAPSVDRVGFPKAYQEKFEVLRSVNKPDKNQVVTVYGNEAAGSIKVVKDLPYPYGSIIVMETASVKTDTQGKALMDEKGTPQKDKVLGLHVMRREKDFGEAYGKNRSGEWEYVEYRADGSHITPPEKSASCSECHVKAGRDRDFVYGGRLASLKGN